MPYRDKYNHVLYEATCNECGWKKISSYSGISIEVANKCNHVNVNGHYINFDMKWSNHRLSKIFNSMKTRCYNESDKSYRWYGAKGIKICDEWLDNPKLFEEWALKNGYQSGLTIDRINEDKDYCPENCRWIPMEENARYKSTTVVITVNDESHTGREWATRLGLGTNVINTYIREHGLENTMEFIKRFMSGPKIERKNKKSFYDMYMNNDSFTA